MSVTAPEGFLASGVACGLKEDGALDLALLSASPRPVAGAAVFTTNLAAAAPVKVSQEHLERSGGAVGAVVLNSGGANAATGPRGLLDAQQTCEVVASCLGIKAQEVLVCSTGLIGVPLAIGRIKKAIPALCEALGSTPHDATKAATAIMTTDTHPKEVLVKASGFSVGGMVKGAGMIAPNMATMLAMLTTDAEISPSDLKTALSSGVSQSFNELIVDNCTSTNDTVVLLASGAAGPVALGELSDAVGECCGLLAREIAKDAEGTTKMATIRILGAKSKGDARRCARGVAASLLVKTSLYGADPYWGRIISELGASGAAFSPDTVRIAYGTTDVVRFGTEIPHDRDAVRSYLEGKEIEITCDLGLGSDEAQVLTTDLGHGYIDENMRTS